MILSLGIGHNRSRKIIGLQWGSEMSNVSCRYLGIGLFITTSKLAAEGRNETVSYFV